MYSGPITTGKPEIKNNSLYDLHPREIHLRIFILFPGLSKNNLRRTFQRLSITKGGQASWHETEAGPWQAGQIGAGNTHQTEGGIGSGKWGGGGGIGVMKWGMDGLWDIGVREEMKVDCMDVMKAGLMKERGSTA